jgi:hypothetical protein
MAEKFREQVLGIDVIILLEHIQQKGLAKSARTDKEDKTIGAFQQRDIVGLIHIVVMMGHYIREVTHPFRQEFPIILLDCFHSL